MNTGTTFTVAKKCSRSPVSSWLLKASKGRPVLSAATFRPMPVLSVTETSIQGEVIVSSFPTSHATSTTLLIPPRERTASRASARATRAVIMALTAAGNRLMNDAKSCTPSSNAARPALTVPQMT